LKRIGVTLVLITASISAAACILAIYLATRAPSAIWLVLPITGILAFMGVLLGAFALQSTRDQ